MPTVLTFDKAIKAAGGKKPHILLGNGFSRACLDKTFSYDAIYLEAEANGLSENAKRAFKALKTTDFELVMRLAKQSALLAREYGRKNLAKTLEALSDELRDALVETIAGNHPDRPHSVEKHRYEACKAFLDNFKDVYTLNYDLLLYWCLMQSEVEPHVECDDGFREPYSGKEEYVTWEVEHTNDQCIFYLHGALHLFDAGSLLQKYTWSNTGVALIDQIRAALDEDKYPLFVSEGTADQKLARIQHSGYLNRAFRSFANIGGVLFIYGWSMGDSDEHIARLLKSTKLTHIFVGLYGDPAGKANKAIIERCRRFGGRGSKTVEVAYFDAASANVWGKPKK